MGDIGKGGETSSDLYIYVEAVYGLSTINFLYSYGERERERGNWFNTDLHSIFCVCLRFNTEGNGYKENFIS